MKNFLAIAVTALSATAASGQVQADIRGPRAGGSLFSAAVNSVSYSPAQAPAVRKVSSGASHNATGAVIYADSWDVSEGRPGFYKVPLSGNPKSLDLLVKSTDVVGDAGSLYFDGKYFVAFTERDYGYIGVSYYVIDVATGSWVDMGALSDAYFKSYSMVYDSDEGIAYGSFGNTATGKTYFGKMDTSTFRVTKIKDYQEATAFFGMGITPEGNLVGIDKSGGFYAIDKASGDLRKIADTGLSTTWITAGVVDPANGKFYYATCNESGSAFYEIDPSTGDAAKVYDLPDNEEFSGLFFTPDPVAALAPGEPSGVRIDFDGVSLSGKVCFTMPSETHDGTPLQGSIDYAVFVDNVQVGSGQAEAGAAVESDVTVDNAGMHEFAVVASNEVGEGNRVSVSAYVGPDVPAPVENVELAYASRWMTLTWSGAQGANGGVIAPGSVKYNVVRYPDGEKVATGITETVFTETYAEPDNGVVAVYYAVEAVSGETVTAPVRSNAVVLGAAMPPCAWSFGSADEIETMTILNANGDTRTWEWDKRGYMGYYYHTSNQADDYIVLPPVRLSAGSTYTFSFQAYRWTGNYPAERVAAYVGRSAEVAALTTCVIEPTVVDSDKPAMLAGNYEAKADGLYYFAVKACSDADCFALYVDNVSVSAPMSGMSPSAPSDLTVTPDPDGALSAVISFNAPDKTITGAPISALGKVEVIRGETVIATLHPQPGQKNVVYTDTEASAGQNDYAVVAYGEDGSVGERAVASAFIGHALPLQPEGLKVESGADGGAVVMSWRPVTSDVNGLSIARGEVTYTVVAIVQGEQSVLTEGLVDTEFDYRVCDADAEQEFLQFAVFAVNGSGASTGCVSLPVAVGAPYTLPFNESFANGAVRHAIATVSDGAVWWTATDDEYEGAVTAQDGDNGFVVMSATSLEGGARLYTGVIDLSGAVEPYLTFYYFTTKSDDENTLAISASRANADEYTALCEPFALGGGTGRGWVKVSLPLSAFAGEKVQLCFEGMILKYELILVDNILVADAASGLDSAVGQSTPVVKGGNGVIVVENAADADVTVSDVSGRVVGTGHGSIRIPVSPAVYIVKVGTELFKVTVR